MGYLIYFDIGKNYNTFFSVTFYKKLLKTYIKYLTYFYIINYPRRT